MAEVAPIPMASEQMLTAVNPGVFAQMRNAWRNGCNIPDLQMAAIEWWDEIWLVKVQEKLLNVLP